MGGDVDEVTQIIQERTGADASLEVLVSPEPDEVVRPGDQLLVIAEDERQAQQLQPTMAPHQGPGLLGDIQTVN